jgi:hypothetical protein
MVKPPLLISSPFLDKKTKLKGVQEGRQPLFTILPLSFQGEGD